MSFIAFGPIESAVVSMFPNPTTNIESYPFTNSFNCSAKILLIFSNSSFEIISIFFISKVIYVPISFPIFCFPFSFNTLTLVTFNVLSKLIFSEEIPSTSPDFIHSLKRSSAKSVLKSIILNPRFLI